jgi:hypothetical protein
MFSQVMTWSGAILGLLVMGAMVVSGLLADSDRN